MTSITRIADQTGAVAEAARITLNGAVTLTKRSEALGESLSTMREAADTEGITFAAYAKAAEKAIREAGDWSRASDETRKAVAVIAGTTGGLSSVMVANALGLSQSTASRAIRAAKAVTVREAGQRAADEALASGADKSAAREAAKAAEKAAEKEAARVITRTGLVVTSGRGSNATTARTGSSVAKSLTDSIASLASLTDGTVSAADLQTLAASLSEAAATVAGLVDDAARREALEAEKAEKEAAEKEAAREAKAAEKAAEKAEKEAAREAAKAARESEREAKAAEKATAREAKKVRPLVAVAIGDEATAAMDDQTVIVAAQRIATAAGEALKTA